MTTDLLERHSTGFVHEALFYTDRGDLLNALTKFIHAGSRTGEPTLVILPPETLRRVKENVPKTDTVEYRDTIEVGRNPARLISIWSDFVQTHGAQGQALRGVCEHVWPDRSVEELAECQIHELLLGSAFDGSNPWTLLCPYDTGSLDPAVIRRARNAHSRPGSPASVSDEGAVELLEGNLAPAPAHAVAFEFDARHLQDLRRLANSEAERAGIGPRSADFVFAVNEVATNSLAHGGGKGTIRLWTTDRSVIAEVWDQGQIRDPLVGRRRPPLRRLGGHGLWMANQLCDLVQVRSREHGTVVRLHMYAT